jgi:hypothetical protein
MKSYIEKIKEIQDALKWDSELFESEIHIEMDNDVVTISGYVDNEQKKRAAENVVRNEEGVKSVVNNIQIKEMIHEPQGPNEVPSPNSGDPDNSLKISGA